LENYKNIFKAIQLKCKLSFEGTYVDGDLAVLVTTSAGTVVVHAAGVEVPEANRELFFLKKESGVWKIAAYMFNKCAAPQGPSDA